MRTLQRPTPQEDEGRGKEAHAEKKGRRHRDSARTSREQSKLMTAGEVLETSWRPEGERVSGEGKGGAMGALIDTRRRDGSPAVQHEVTLRSCTKS